VTSVFVSPDWSVFGRQAFFKHARRTRVSFPTKRRRRRANERTAPNSFLFPLRFFRSVAWLGVGPNLWCKWRVPGSPAAKARRRELSFGLVLRREALLLRLVVVYLYLICLSVYYCHYTFILICTCSRDFLNSECAFNRSFRFLIADHRQTGSIYLHAIPRLPAT
jgi:hypothetical protein